MEKIGRAITNCYIREPLHRFAGKTSTGCKFPVSRQT
jgi:hypothetical protein